MTPQQIEQLQQLLKLLPQIGQQSNSFVGDTDEDLKQNLAGMISCSHAGLFMEDWISDSGAIDHMTYLSKHTIDQQSLAERYKMTLPNGHTSKILQIGRVKLSAELILKDVLYVPSFKYDMLSVPKLTKDNNYVAIFYSDFVFFYGLCMEF